jgi:hypothetical protein
MSEIAPPKPKAVFKLAGNFYRFKEKDQIPETYECSEGDFKFYGKLCESLKLDQKVFPREKFEAILNAWENDTGKGEIFPIERALILVKDNGFDFPQSADVVPKMFSYW